MKIVCGSCSAKYSIADEKVQGKVFKIRCRKCSNVIVVKGTEDEASGAASAASYGGTASTPEWYVVIDGEQAGPLTPEDLESYYTNGQVSLESFIWRDGMADWTPLGQVEMFAHLALGGGSSGGYDEDATSLVESPMNATSDYEEDATAVVDAHAWRQQQDQQDAEAAAAAASVGAGGYAAADFGGADPMGADPYAAAVDPYADPTASSADPYGSNDPYGMGSDVSAQAADPYGASDPYAAASDPYATPAQAEVQQGYGGLDAGFGSEPADIYGGADGGYNAQASVGGDGGGLFSSFDADAGNDGGLAYQSFSGLDSLQASGVDLNNSNGGASIESGMGSAQAASTSNNFDDANDLVGSRNENSVLFSLSSLQQVEAVKGPSDDVPLTDGSGLIDIQSLASAHQSMAGSGGGGPSSSPFDGPSSAPAVETFSPATMSVPAIMPRGTHRDNKPLIIAVIGLALLLGLGGIGAAVYFATRTPEPVVQPQTGVTAEELQKQLKELKDSQPKSESESEKQARADEIAALAKKIAADQEAANKANTGVVEEEPEKDDKSGKSTTKRKKTPRKDTSVSSKDSDPPKQGGRSTDKKSDIDNLLGKLDDKDKPKADKPKPKEDTSSDSGTSKLPKKLGRTVVQNTIKKYNSKAKSCGKSSNSGNLSGSVSVKFNIAPSGKISSASITSSNFKGTDVGNCVLKVVRGMKFPAAKESTPISKYPFFI